VGFHEVDADGRLVRINQTELQMLGYSAEELLGRFVWEISADEEISHRSVLAKLGGETPPALGFKRRFRRKDGSVFPVLINDRLLKREDGVILGIRGSIQDLTERDRAETALAQEQAMFSSLMATIPDMIYFKDRQSRFVRINKAQARHFGLRDIADAVGKTDFDFHGEEHARQAFADEQQIMRTGIPFVAIEEKETWPDGHVTWASSTKVALRDTDGLVTGLVGISRDVTERRKLEEQFRHSQKMESIGTLAGGIAHDFNNILAAMNGYTELTLLKFKDNAELSGHLAVVAQAGKRATNLVRQILTFSRREQSQRLPIRLRPVVEECIELLRATIPSTIQFDVSLSGNTPTVLADTNQIHQILMNLGTNAWHAMRDRPGRLQIKLDKFVIDEAYAATQSRLRPGVYTRVSVSDTGCGMDQATQRRIFEPFFTTKAPGEGTGLGLSVVYGIMESHDGAITVYSQPGEGTVFHLYFPARAGETTPLIDEESAIPHGHGERLLFVDDEEILARLGRETLSHLGYAVEIATQPALALALVRADPLHFALVITDQTMPGMTGLELATELKQIRPGLPIILMSGYSRLLTPKRIKKAGVHQLLLKPASIHTLGTAVHASLSAQTPR
jgi:PAS domain S-box-containing protein